MRSAHSTIMIEDGFGNVSNDGRTFQLVQYQTTPVRDTPSHFGVSVLE